MGATLPKPSPTTQPTLRRELEELEELGHIRRLPGDRYELTALGEQALKATS